MLRKMAQSLECNCCRCELNKALTYELSDGAFPIYNYKGVQEFNVLDVDRFGGAVLVDHLNPDTLVFKQRPLQGRYCPSGTGVRPLTAPHSSQSYCCALPSCNHGVTMNTLARWSFVARSSESHAQILGW